MKKFIVTVFAFALLLNGCYYSYEPKELPSTTPEVIYKPGEVARIDSYEITIDKVEKSINDGLDAPKSGHEYVIVTLTMKNIGDKIIDCSPIDFKMLNSQGQIHDRTILWEDDELESMDLAPGGQVTGRMAWEQPIDDKLILIFQPNALHDEKVLKFAIN